MSIGERKNASLWERDAATDEPRRLEGPVHADACVIGLGGSGLTAVHELLDRGASVVGLDAGPVAGGAAGRNGGLLLGGLAPFHHDAADALGRERAASLYRATLEELTRIEAATPGIVRRTGSLRIADDGDEWSDCLAQLDAMARDGLEAQRYEGPEGRGLLFPRDASYDPLARCRALAVSAAARGAELFTYSQATSIRTGRVSTPGGTVETDAVLVCVDGHLERLLPELEGRVRTARLQMLGTAPAQDVSLPRPMYLRDGYEYAQQRPSGEIALGGFRDRHEAQEWTHDAEPTDAIQDLLTGFLRERIGTEARVTHRWAASVAYVHGGVLPITEEVRPRVFAAGGYSGTGNLVGALAGRSIAGRALGLDTPFTDLFS